MGFAEWIGKENYITTTLGHEKEWLWQKMEADEKFQIIDHPEITTNELYALYLSNKQS